MLVHGTSCLWKCKSRMHEQSKAMAAAQRERGLLGEKQRAAPWNPVPLRLLWFKLLTNHRPVKSYPPFSNSFIEEPHSEL